MSRSARAVLAFVAAGLAACTSSEPPEPEEGTEPADDAQAAAQQDELPFRPEASVADLMRSVINYAAEDYWSSVSIIVDADGVTENMPETTEEWRRVWSAGISLAESGNLLMIPPRNVDDGDWIRYSEDMVEVGMQAAQAAADRDFDAVLENGEYIYNVCLDCHRQYVPTLPDL